MPNRRLLAALTAASLLFAGLPTISPVAAASCSGWSSETVPPPVIRVFRTATGAVDTVDFRTYAANVLSREWISSWTTESIRAGALAVKNYAWYQVLHWRGYTSPAGACFDVFDSTRDQHYDPSRPTYGPMVAAIDATWTTLAVQNGRIFAAYYNAGGVGEACGANVNGWQMFQWGSQACGLAGLSAAQIMATYYPGVQVSAAPPPAPPPATPSPTPPPAPSPTAIPAPSGAPVPVATPTPTPTPAPPAPPIELPGGGQQAVAPAPPPPPNPAPIVVAPVAFEAVAAVGEPQAVALSARRHAWREPPRWVDGAPAHRSTAVQRIDPRLAAFAALWPERVEALVAAIRVERAPWSALARWFAADREVARR